MPTVLKVVHVYSLNFHNNPEGDAVIIIIDTIFITIIIIIIVTISFIISIL